MKKIRVYNIEYLALIDKGYAEDYCIDNEMTEDEKKDWLSELGQKTEVIIEIEHDFSDDDELQEYLELQELCEYIHDFEWEYVNNSLEPYK